LTLTILERSVNDHFALEHGSYNHEKSGRDEYDGEHSESEVVEGNIVIVELLIFLSLEVFSELGHL
jgi:hypothetical protein